MNSKSKIERFSRDWLKWYPETTRDGMRTVLNRRFRKSWSAGNVAEGAVDEAVRVPMADGWLLAFFLGPLVAIRQWLFPVTPARPEDIDAVLAELDAKGQWPDPN